MIPIRFWGVLNGRRGGLLRVAHVGVFGARAPSLLRPTPRAELLADGRFRVEFLGVPNNVSPKSSTSFGASLKDVLQPASIAQFGQGDALDSADTMAGDP